MLGHVKALLLQKFPVSSEMRCKNEMQKSSKRKGLNNHSEINQIMWALDTFMVLLTEDHFHLCS